MMKSYSEKETFIVAAGTRKRSRVLLCYTEQFQLLSNCSGSFDALKFTLSHVANENVRLRTGDLIIKHNSINDNFIRTTRGTS